MRLQSQQTAESRVLALVVPSAGRPWVIDTTGAALAQQLELAGPDVPDLVGQARHAGIELHLAMTHAELPRWWSAAIAHGLQSDAGAILDRLRLHVPGMWRSSELGVSMLHALQDLYDSHVVPALIVDTVHGRAVVTCGPWIHVAGNLTRSRNIKVVPLSEVQRALRALAVGAPWLKAAVDDPDRAWLAVSIENGGVERRTVYVPAPEPVQIDPRGALWAPPPAQFAVTLALPAVGTISPRSLAILGPYPTAQQADAQHDKACAVVERFAWAGTLETQPVILPGRLTMAGHVARHLNRQEHV